LARAKRSLLAIECKWSESDFHAGNLQAFRRSYPQGDNLVVANDVQRSFSRSYGGVSVKFVSLSELIAQVTRKQRRRTN
jgi:hypothetical protein